jgi:uncharacterized protein (DUF433 family)
MDWLGYADVEIIPGKVSGAPVLKGTRLPVDAVIENFDAFLAEGLSEEAALAETLDCYPAAGIDRIRGVLKYRATHQHQLQP